MQNYNGQYPYELYHFGVKGMKWGERKQIKQAKKDAKKYARAKMFYGEGAGNRRKLIKNEVSQRSKDPTYKKAFDEALSKQDMAKHAVKARHERNVRDVGNVLTGHPERAAIGVALIATGVGIAHKTGIDKAVANVVKRKYSEVRNYAKNYNMRRRVSNILKNLSPN